MRTADLFTLPDVERIAAARWAAIKLLYPVIGDRRRRRVGWHHRYTSAGSILSERRPG